MQALVGRNRRRRAAAAYRKGGCRCHCSGRVCFLSAISVPKPISLLESAICDLGMNCHFSTLYAVAKKFEDQKPLISGARTTYRSFSAIGAFLRDLLCMPCFPRKTISMVELARNLVQTACKYTGRKSCLIPPSSFRHQHQDQFASGN